MLKKKLIALAAVAGLGAAPVVAQVAQPALAPVVAENELGGDNAGITAAILIAGIVAIAVFAFSDDDDEPVSN